MDDLKPRWTTWAGGDFLPVPPEMRVSVLLRDGSIEGPSAAREFAGADSCWRHRGSAGDIVAYAEADDRDARIAELERERNERLEHLFDIQWKRTREAGELWRQAHPGNELVSPDLGELVKWLMDRATAAEERLKEAMQTIEWIANDGNGELVDLFCLNAGATIVERLTGKAQAFLDTPARPFKAQEDRK